MEKLSANQVSTQHWPLKAKLLAMALIRTEYGQLSLIDPDGNRHVFVGSKSGPIAEITIKNWSAINEIFSKGDIGLAESYRDELIDLKDIALFIEWACLNEDALIEQFHGNWLGTFIYKLKHIFNRNTPSNSKKNISAHYDLGNSFYQIWLDRSMTYSSAYFKNNDESLYQAQINKYHKIIDQLGIKSGDTVLEIGCGWGGFITEAVLKGINVVALTISEEQYKYVENLIQVNGWDSQVTLLKQDYRHHLGKYDYIVSIEMIEAVGYEYWGTYFEKVSNCLNKGGKALIQGISIRDESFEDYLSTTDFIQQYIFPGGMLLADNAAAKVWESKGLQAISIDKFGKSYAKTLNLWAKEFNLNLDKVQKLNFDKSFIRIWNFYLGYCEGAFDAGRVDVGHYLLEKK